MKQAPNIHTHGRSNILKSRYGGSIYASLHKSNKINRVICFFRELFLGEVCLAAEMGNIPAEQSVEVSHAASLKELERSGH